MGVLAFLKNTQLLFNIINIQSKAGVVSDCTEVFTNIYDIAFPTSKKTQCAVHIQRKLWKGVGNGAYSKYIIDKPFLNDTARIDVNNLYHCITQKQFSKYAEVVKEGWTDAQKRDSSTHD